MAGDEGTANPAPLTHHAILRRRLPSPIGHDASAGTWLVQQLEMHWSYLGSNGAMVCDILHAGSGCVFSESVKLTFDMALSMYLRVVARAMGPPVSSHRSVDGVNNCKRERNARDSQACSNLQRFFCRKCAILGSPVKYAPQCRRDGSDMLATLPAGSS